MKNKLFDMKEIYIEMKRKISTWSFIMLWIFPGLIYGQADCKVLKPEISLIYKGECKNGLAHGKGEASGRDVYRGEFKKGLPHGQGIYEWVSGAIYEGQWKKGKRNGQGKYSYLENGKEVTKEGLWINDKYQGISVNSGVKVIRKRNLDRYSAIRRGDGNQVLFRLIRTGTGNADVQDLMLIGNSGSQVKIVNLVGFDYVRFPFMGKISYSSWNKLKTIRLEVLFEFEIKQPGIWEITIHN